MPNQYTQPNVPEERFWAKVNKADGCWLWNGSLSTKGYGQFSLHGHRVMAHRYAYELLVGPIPEELTLDHLCRIRHCVNPVHVEPVTNRENILRGNGRAALAARAIHCPQGHPYDLLNTIIRPSGHRGCRTCHRESNRIHQQA